jgi:hypothetical protein
MRKWINDLFNFKGLQYYHWLILLAIAMILTNLTLTIIAILGLIATYREKKKKKNEI